jgi:hypothetical protein
MMTDQEAITDETKTAEEVKSGDDGSTPGEPKKQEKPKADEELRSSPRLQCSGLAGIQTLPANERPCPAKIINLSIGGCLMKAERPLNIVVDEIVELIFCVNRIPFRVRGKVRAVRSEALTCFQFPYLSARSRRQLEELIGELIEHLVKLHLESIANRPVPDDERHLSVPSVRKAHAIGMLYPIRPDDDRQGNTSHHS